MSIVFTFVSFALNNTRAVHLDTDYVAATLIRNGVAVGPQEKKIGDVNNGTHGVGLNFQIPNEYNSTDKFVFSYLIINHGGGGTQDVLNCCQKAITSPPLTVFDAADAAIVATGGGHELPTCLTTGLRAKDNLEGWWNQIKTSFQHVSTNLCDGPVAIDRISFTGSSIDQLILSNQFSIIYLGTDSAVGCGSNSHYSVQWTVKVT